MKKGKRVLSLLLAALMLLGTVSALPMTASAAKPESAPADVVINPVDYGADPSGVKDSADAIWKALEAAKAASEGGTKSVELRFPKGEYHIYKDHAQKRVYHTSNTDSLAHPEKTIGLLIEEQQNLTINGCGSLFMMHGNMMALAVVKSKNITLKDLSWDFGVPTVTEMTVLAMGRDDAGRPYTDFYIPKCFPHRVEGNSLVWTSELSPYTGSPYWTQRNNHSPSYGYVGYRPTEHMTRRYPLNQGPFHNVAAMEELDSTTVRITYNGSRPHPAEVGFLMEFVASGVRETAGAFTWESENVVADHVNVHYMHGFGWLLQMTKDVYFYDCNLMPRENSGHVTVSFADGIHASGCAGEVVIQNCNFSQTHDDPINMHGTFTRVEQRKDDHTLVLKYIHKQQGGFPQFHEGDKVRFFTRDTLESTDNETHYTVVSATDPGADGKTMTVTFKEKLPTNLTERVSGEPKYVAENVTYAPKVTIKGCTFQNVATRAILCTSCQPVVIEDNIFYPSSMAAIFLSNDADEWYESGPIRDMTIRNNVFYVKDIGGRENWPYAPAIYVHPVTKNKGLPAASNPIHKNITIEGNTFVMDEDMVVKAESVEKLTIRNNKVLRMNPNIQLTLNLDKQTLAVGESGRLQTQTSGKTNNKAWDHLYDFTKCKDVIIEGNTYDDGMKNYIVTDDASKTTLTNKDSIPVRNNRNEAAAPAVGQLLYVSSDPQVASVDETGTVWAGKPGTAEIFAYYPWNGTAVLSNKVTVTVEGEAHTGTLTIQGPEEVKVGQTGTFTAQDAQNVTWTVQDFLTGGETNLATIENGTLQANGKGVIWVQATAENASAKVPVVLYEETSKVPTMEVIREDTSKYQRTADSLTIQMQKCDLYKGDNTLKNLFVYTPEDSTDVRATVKVSGLPVREGGQWDTASFILYQNDDNYVTIGKKSHYDGFATVVEKNAQAEEFGGSNKHNQVKDAWLGITRTGNTITLSAKVEGGDWETVKTIDNSTLNDKCKLGFGVWHANDRGKSVTFSEFKVGTADTAFDALTAVPFIQDIENDRPVVTGVTMSNTGSTVTAEAAITDKNGAGESLYLWTWEQNGQTVTRVTKEKSVDVKGAKSVTCQVFPVDTLGQPGKPFEKQTYTLETGSASGFASVEVNGSALKEAETTVVVPAGVKLNLRWSAAEAVTLTKNGTNVAVDNLTELALDVQNEDTLVLACGEDTRTIHIQTAASNDARLISVTSEDLGLTDGTLPNGVHSADATASVTIQAAPGASVELLQGDYRIPVKLSNGTAQLQFVNGLNTFYIRVTAADGVTVTEKTLNVVYTPSGDQEVTGISINGEALAGFAADKYNYTVQLAEKPAKLDVQVDVSAGSRVSMVLNETAQSGSTVSFQNLKDGKNQLTIQAKAADGITVVNYRIELICPDDTNAELQSVKVGEKEVLDQLTAETESEISWNENEAPVELSAQDLRTKVELLKNGRTIATGTGKLSHTLPLTGERPVYTIRTTAVDGTTKTWTVAFTNTCYLSDLDWTSATVGYGDYVRRDKNIDDKPITLTTENHEGQTFRKGLGVHAESVVVYNIAGKGYQNLHGFVGIDHSEHNADYGDVQFVVLVDDQKVFDDVMLKNTPMKELNVDIPADAKTLTLKALNGPSGKNWNDHADWGEMKLTLAPYSSEAMDPGALQTAIDEAKRAKDGITVSDKTPEEVAKDTKFVSTVADKALTDAIAAAETALETAKNQDELDAAAAALRTAVETYQNAIQTGTYVEPEKPVEPEQPDKPVEPERPHAPIDPVKPEKPETTPGTSFVDVPMNEWFYDAVEYVSANGLMSGVGNGQFAPHAATTRGMIVTVLHRMEQKPAAGAPDFDDVAADAWYAEAVGWASENGVVTGYGNGKFGPEDQITREQLAAILYRFAKQKGCDMTASKELSSFADAASVSSYAQSAMEWAVAEGLINGMDGALAPQGRATRAQVAAILMRFCENILK